MRSDDNARAPTSPGDVHAPCAFAFRHPVLVVTCACGKGDETITDVVEQAVGFGYKSAWLAIKSGEPSAVIGRLGITGARPSPWQDGIRASYEGHEQRIVYVTPSLDGWVLVAGPALFSLGRKSVDDPHFAEVVASLSASLATVVQYFATHRVSEAHSWIFAEDGRTVRACSVGDGEIRVDEGELTIAEKALDIDIALDTDEETVMQWPQVGA